MTEYLQKDRKSSHQHWRSPFSEMPEEWIENEDTLPCRHPRIAFRQVARSTDTRTIITALVPPETCLTHHSWYCIWPKGDKGDEAYLLAILSSIPFDWYARRFVEANVTKTLMKTFPVPREDGPLRERAVELSGRLAAVDDRYADWANAVGVEYGPLDEDMKQEKIYELDAVVAHLYGLSHDHVKMIFETFHEGWDYEKRLNRVLDYYADWADRLDLDHADREKERAAGTRHND